MAVGWEEEMSLERRFEITPAYDKRAEGYGQGSATMTFFVIGPLGAIQFKLMTGWYPGIIKKTTFTDWSDWAELRVRDLGDLGKPMPMDLGYHSHAPHYEGQELMDGKCRILNGPCYYDGSGLNAEKPFSILVHEGSERLWEFLEMYYRDTFEKKSEAA
jgi:hypothetical protein